MKHVFEKYEDVEKRRAQLKKIHLHDYDEGAFFCMRDDGTITVMALNEGGYNGTEVSLIDILKKTKKHFPSLLKEVMKK